MKPAPLTDKEVNALKHSDRGYPHFIAGACTQCGNCCKYYECKHYKEGCTIYPNRPAGCRVWPQDRQEIKKVNCKGLKCLRG